MKYSKRRLSSKRQAGAALIIALLIVFIVASLSVTISSDFLVMIRRVENQTHSGQAYAYLVGAEGLARLLVLEDENTNLDHLGESLLAEARVVPINHAGQLGQYTGGVVDLQSRLNINNLLPAAGGAGAAYSVSQQRFIRLLQTLELDEPLDQQVAEEITNAVIDWLDPDSNERPGGAEDLFYGDAIPAGKAANRKMISISELRWVKGITAEIYQALKPHITVWGEGNININTASENVLRSLNADKVLTPLTAAEIATLTVEQEEKSGGFDDLSVFESPPLKDLGLIVDDLSVKSDFFLLSSSLLFQDREFLLNSVIKREPGKATVVARSRAGF